MYSATGSYNSSFAKKRNTKIKKGNNRKSTRMRKRQQIMSSKRQFIGRYLSPKGQRLVDEGVLSEKEADNKYGKNRYDYSGRTMVKVITHNL